MGKNTASFEYVTHQLAKVAKSVNDISPVDGDIALTAFDIPYAYYTLDVTNTPAPPALPRARSWRVEFVGPLMGSYDYRRYFYLSAQEASIDDPSTAAAAWVIDGQRMFFEYREGGAVISTVELTDTGGNVLRTRYRPIRVGGLKWFFGPNHGTNAFPGEDNVRSIIDLDIDAINTIIGSTFDLSTNAKQIVNAINELYALYRSDSHVYITHEDTPDNLTGLPNDVAITPYGVYAYKLLISTGFRATTTDTRFSGIWTDMGVNTAGTISGISLNTHWYMHESGNYVLVWSNFNNNPNTPRAGYWFINNTGTPRLDSGSLIQVSTPNVPPASTYLPPNGNWGAATITWSNYTSSQPSGLGWELQFGINTTPNGKLFINGAETAVVPMPPATGTVRLVSVGGVLQWVT